MSRSVLVILASLALSLCACAEKPGAKKDDKKDAKDGKAKADAKAETKTDDKAAAKPE